MTDTLNAEQTSVIRNLFASNPSFRNAISRLVLDETAKARKVAEELAKFGSTETPTPTEKPVRATKGKKRPGRPKGSKNKSKKQPTNGSAEPVEASARNKTTHKDAVSQVLSKAGNNGMTSGEIFEALQKSNIPNYSAPEKSGTLLTILHGMKKDSIVKQSGKRPAFRYTLA